MHDTSVMSICLHVLHALYVLFYEYRIVYILHVVYIFGLIGYCCCENMYDECMKCLLQFVLPVVYIAILHLFQRFCTVYAVMLLLLLSHAWLSLLSRKRQYDVPLIMLYRI